jgi:hypothetical protein
MNHVYLVIKGSGTPDPHAYFNTIGNGDSFSHADPDSNCHVYTNTISDPLQGKMFTDAEAASNSAPPALTRHMIPERSGRAPLSISGARGWCR